MNPKLLFAFTLLTVNSLVLLNSCMKTPDDNPPVSTTTTSTTSSTGNPSICDTCLPPITKGGRNTFGCKINGKIWLPQGGGFSQILGAEYTSSKILVLFAKKKDERQGISFNLGPINNAKLYTFRDVDLTTAKILYYDDPTDANPDKFEYIIEPADNGYVEITHFDYSPTGFVSGTFAFDLYDNKGDTVHITEGRFDIRF